MTSCPSSVHLWSTRSFSQSVRKAVCKEQQLAPAAGMLFYANSGPLKFTCVVDFFLQKTRSAHYNFCLQKWTYFRLLDTQGIVLCTLIQEVSFLSRYTLLLHSLAFFYPTFYFLFSLFSFILLFIFFLSFILLNYFFSLSLYFFYSIFYLHTFSFLFSTIFCFTFSLPFFYPTFYFLISFFLSFICPVPWGCKIHQLLLCKVS